jgi:hypothetical protein
LSGAEDAYLKCRGAKKKAFAELIRFDWREGGLWGFLTANGESRTKGVCDDPH